jgi:hypothetical protein
VKHFGPTGIEFLGNFFDKQLIVESSKIADMGGEGMRGGLHRSAHLPEKRAWLGQKGFVWKPEHSREACCVGYDGLFGAC